MTPRPITDNDLAYWGVDRSRMRIFTAPAEIDAGVEPCAGASASLYYHGSDVLKVFTSSAAPLVADETYTLWGFHVALEHGGDHAAAARHVRALMPSRPRRARCPHCGSTNTEVRT